MIIILVNNDLCMNLNNNNNNLRMRVCVYVNTYSFELISLLRQASCNVYGYFAHVSEILNCVLA